MDKSFLEFVTEQTVATKHLAGKHDQSRHGIRAGAATPAQLAARQRAAAGRERKRQAAAAAAAANKQPVKSFSERFGKSSAPSGMKANDLNAVADDYVLRASEYIYPPHLKDKVCTNLSDATGIEYDKVNRAIHLWALSSNDNINCLNMQRVAGEIFGANFTNWQKQKYESAKRNIDSRLSDDEAKTFLQEMYKQTQADFASKGIKTVVIYRGYNIEHAISADEAKNFMRGDKTKIEMNAMSSWTSAKDIASAFGFGGGGNRLVIRIEVPVSRIIATPHTGFGCYSEREFVLLGDPDGDVVSIVGGMINGINL